MSQIFDALQRTEAKRSGLDPAKLTAAAELLELAERQAVQVTIDGDCREDDQHRGNSKQTAKLDVGQWAQFPLAQVMVPPQSKLVCITDEDSLAAEKFRFLGVRLRHLQQKRSLKRLLITSSMAEEGKSMISANLACTLARKQQQKILLLEGDLRRPTLAEQFGLGKIPGLSELLQGAPCTAMNICQLCRHGVVDLTCRQPVKHSLGTYTIPQALHVNRSIERLVRLDCDRLSPVDAAGGYQRLDAPGRWDPPRGAAGQDRKTSTTARSGSDRAVKAAGRSAQWFRGCWSW